MNSKVGVKQPLSPSALGYTPVTTFRTAFSRPITVVRKLDVVVKFDLRFLVESSWATRIAGQSRAPSGPPARTKPLTYCLAGKSSVHRSIYNHRQSPEVPYCCAQNPKHCRSPHFPGILIVKSLTLCHHLTTPHDGLLNAGHVPFV